MCKGNNLPKVDGPSQGTFENRCIKGYMILKNRKGTGYEHALFLSVTEAFENLITTSRNKTNLWTTNPWTTEANAKSFTDCSCAMKQVSQTVQNTKGEYERFGSEWNGAMHLRQKTALQCLLPSNQKWFQNYGTISLWKKKKKKKKSFLNYVNIIILKKKKKKKTRYLLQHHADIPSQKNQTGK